MSEENKTSYSKLRGRGRPRIYPRIEQPQSVSQDFVSQGQTINIPLDQLDSVDLSNLNIEKIARGFFIGKKAIGYQKDVRKILEDRVVKRVGNKGKLIVDKLFELINGIKVASKINKITNDVEEYYTTPPNLNAIMYALDRVLGKPKQVNLQGNFSLSKLLVEAKSNGVATPIPVIKDEEFEATFTEE